MTTTPDLSAPEAVLADISEMLREVLGEYGLDDAVITMDTKFHEDLELESIEFVALAEKLQARYEKVDFVRWLSEKELEEIIELKVGDVVTYIDTCR